MSIYLHLDGKQGEIKGNVTDKNHTDWIQLDSAEFNGVVNRVNMITGQTTHAVNGKPAFGEFSMTKGLDASSNLLFQYAHTGEVIHTATIHYVSADNPVKVYFEIILENVFISFFNHSHPGGNHYPGEKFNLSYTQIEQKYLGTDKDATPIPSGYNISTASSL